MRRPLRKPSQASSAGGLTESPARRTRRVLVTRKPGESPGELGSGVLRRRKWSAARRALPDNGSAVHPRGCTSGTNQASFVALHSLFFQEGPELNPTGESESRHKNLFVV